jgi:hypothetical protein
MQGIIMGKFVQNTEYDVHMYAKSEYSHIYGFYN